MKKSLLFCCICFISIFALGQNCVPTALIFQSQSQIDSFPINYPNCTSITGSIGVVGQNISNLDSLSQITNIQGSLQILDAPNIVSLEGLNSLKFIGGILRIEKSGIEDFTGLDSLNAIGGSFLVSENDSLLNCTGLSFLKTIGGNFETNNCSSFINYEGLSELDTIKGDFNLNPNVINCIGLNSLKYIGGSFGIEHNIRSLFGLDNLEIIKGSFVVSNTLLQNFQGVGKLALVDNEFVVGQNDSLVNFMGLDSLHAIGSLRIFWNPLLNSLSGLNGIDSFKGNFSIVHNYQDLNISALSGLEDFKGDLNLEGNIVGFQIFNNIDSLTSLGISNNSSIQEFSYFDSLKYVPVLGFNNNPSLVSITGFTNLQEVNLLSITGNQFLVSIEGFNHPIQISNNPSIYNNIILSNCNVVPICSLAWQVPNFIGFFGNLTGCNSKHEISLSCGTEPDLDGDGVNDFIDNCPNTQNANQLDCNNNGIGDACDFPDLDCDGIADGVDNCPSVYNPIQIDNNNNGIGDACEQFPRLGFGTTNPKSEYHFSNGTIYLDNPEKQLILRKDNGECYTLRVVGNTLQAHTIPCPQ